MGKYLALQIIAGRLEYKAVIARYEIDSKGNCVPKTV